MKLFTMSLKEEELKKYHDLAKAHGLPLSKLIRALLDKQKIKPRAIPKADPELLRKVAGIGNSLSYLTQRLKQSEEEEVLPLIESIHQQLEKLIQ